jgi:peptide deformylase
LALLLLDGASARRVYFIDIIFLLIACTKGDIHMAIRRIITLSDPQGHLLKTKAKKVTRFDASLERLVKDMWETMYDAPGVGLAAPQIAIPLRVLVAEYEGERAVLVNPEIIKMEGEELGTEGCLSIPDYVGKNIRRAAKVVVKARNEKGSPVKIATEGWFARVLQHEIDHLNGILYTDRLDRPEDFVLVPPDEEDEELAPPSKATA